MGSNSMELERKLVASGAHVYYPAGDFSLRKLGGGGMVCIPCDTDQDIEDVESMLSTASVVLDASMSETIKACCNIGIWIVRQVAAGRKVFSSNEDMTEGFRLSLPHIEAAMERHKKRKVKSRRKRT